MSQGYEQKRETYGPGSTWAAKNADQLLFATCHPTVNLIQGCPKPHPCPLRQRRGAEGKTAGLALPKQYEMPRRIRLLVVAVIAVNHRKNVKMG